MSGPYITPDRRGELSGHPDSWCVRNTAGDVIAALWADETRFHIYDEHGAVLVEGNRVTSGLEGGPDYPSLTADPRVSPTAAPPGTDPVGSPVKADYREFPVVARPIREHLATVVGLAQAANRSPAQIADAVVVTLDMLRAGEDASQQYGSTDMPPPVQWEPAEAFEQPTLPLADVLEAAADGDSITDAWHKVAAKQGLLHSVMYRDGHHGTLCGLGWPVGGQMLRATSVADDVTCKDCRAKLDPGQVKADVAYGQPAHYTGTSISRAKTAAGRARDNSQRIRELYEAGIVHVPAGAPLEDVERALWGTDEEAQSTREAFRTALSTSPGLAMGLTAAEKDAIALSARLWDALVGITADGAARSGDLAELARSIHDIQARIMAQAGARAHPDLLRPLGGDPVTP